MTIPFRNFVTLGMDVYPSFELESTIQQMKPEDRVIEVGHGQAMTVAFLQQALLKADEDKKPVLLRKARKEDGWDYEKNTALQTYEYDEVYVIPQSGINDQYFHIVSITRVPRLSLCKFVMTGSSIHIGTIPQADIIRGSLDSDFCDIYLGFHITEIDDKSIEISYDHLTSYLASLGFV